MKLADIAMEEYRASAFDMRCLYPAVLVRVLPKEGTTRSGLILPEVADKIQYEGIVLRTWGTHKVNWKGKEVIVECEVKPGDHVLFPHWCGESVRGLNTEEYRMIPSRSYFGDAGQRDSGEILLVINKEAVNPLEKIIDKIRDEEGNAYWLDKFGKWLEKEFDIFPKVTKSITTSGTIDKRDRAVI